MTAKCVVCEADVALPENCCGAYEAFKGANDEIHSLSELGAFADGFRLGIRLGMEIMQTE